MRSVNQSLVAPVGEQWKESWQEARHMLLEAKARLEEEMRLTQESGPASLPQIFGQGEAAI